jgi:hypothetical protein
MAVQVLHQAFLAHLLHILVVVEAVQFLAHHLLLVALAVVVEAQQIQMELLAQ